MEFIRGLDLRAGLREYDLGMSIFTTYLTGMSFPAVFEESAPHPIALIRPGAPGRVYRALVRLFSNR